MAITEPTSRRHLRLVSDLPVASESSVVTIDCGMCEQQASTACDDCLVSYLVGADEGTPVMLDHDEKRAVDLLADAGLVPPSRFSRRSGTA